MLTLEQRGAYITLTDLMYQIGEPIPANKRYIAGQLGCAPGKAVKVVTSHLMMQLVYLTSDDKLSSYRVEEELAYARERSQIYGSNARRKNAAGAA